MFASIIAGHDGDLWILVAMILFVISAVWLLTERAVQPALVSAGLAFLALGFLVA
jgi:NADH:ubiquinone oxidoreductase subunit K